MDLGNAQYWAGQYPDSVQSLNTAIENIGKVNHRVEERQVNDLKVCPLLG